MLAGTAPASRAGDSEPEKGADARREEPARADPPAAPTTVRLRLTDAGGTPIPWVHVTVTTRTPAAKTEELRFRADADGVVALELPAGTVEKVVVEGRGGAPNPLMAWTAPEEVERLAPGDLVVPEVLHLVVRTVDSYGNPRAEQRILYRVEAEEGGHAGGNVWGETSDAEGLCRLGPFPPGTRLGLRPGPRGEGSPFRLTDWRSVVVNGTRVDLTVGDAPRLRLRFRGAQATEEVRIAVLDPATGEPTFPPDSVPGDSLWTAPALALERVEVLAGPTAAGRVARVLNVVPTAEPIDVDLLPGVPIQGRLSAPGMRTPLRGTVEVRGRGFLLSLPLDADGSFRVPGLPDEPAVFVAAATVEGGVSYRGAFERRDEREVVVPVDVAFRVAGLVVPAEALEEPPRPVRPHGNVRVRAESSEVREPVVVNAASNGRFTLVLPAGRWRLEASAWAKDAPLVGSLDLGEVDAAREDVVIPLSAPR
jgi:hypothetical protein